MRDEIISVGIDIGTSTSSMVVSRLAVRNTASCFTVPHVEITDKEIIYRSRIYRTPQETGNRIDIEAISQILKKEYQKAGIKPEDVQTGAVIITGESSRKENARLVTERMSSLAGEFVVASAGPDLESMIAGKGSGAQEYSEAQASVVANFDVGGGTSNIAIFKNGELLARGCCDIGGRLIRVENGKVAYISQRLRHIVKETGAKVAVGGDVNIRELQRVTECMAGILGESVGLLPESSLCALSKTAGSSDLKKPKAIDGLFFSGGVADFIYHPSEDWFRYGDIGLLLADSIRRSPWVESSHLIPAKETIRATVIGAGSYTTTVSGSTVSFSGHNTFPMKNVPAFTVSEEEEAKLLTGQAEAYIERAAWFLRESSTDNIIFVLSHIKRPAYRQILMLAEVFAKASEVLKANQPLLVVCRDDFAKALGMAIERTGNRKRPIVCLDNIYAAAGDYIDLGRPLMNGLVVPVVVKTLLFG